MPLREWFKRKFRTKNIKLQNQETEKTLFKCSICGEQHSEWPALAFSSPANYAGLTQTEQNSIAEIDEDFCVITYEDQTDRFIRTTLVQKVNDFDKDLDYGLWVSLSENSFKDYKANFNNENHETSYFGWLCNGIPGYEFKQSIPMTVWTKTGNDRPEIIPHEDFNHKFVKDYYFGITKAEAERRIHDMMKNVG